MYFLWVDMVKQLFPFVNIGDIYDDLCFDSQQYIVKLIYMVV